MGMKAIDVVLLPEEAMMDRAVKANRELVGRYGSEIELNKKDCLPHISLAMGCVDEEQIAAVGGVLKAIAEKSALGGLRVVGVRSSSDAVGQVVSVFAVEKSERLQSIHEEVMDRLSAYLRHDVTREMLYNPTEVGESTLLWIGHYREKSSFGKFFPHITIGYGEVEQCDVPIEFGAECLALCHLGNHCTCRRVLLSARLAAG